MPLKRTVKPGYTKKHARVAKLSALRKSMVVVHDGPSAKRSSKTYTPNGPRERARRIRQMERGII